MELFATEDHYILKQDKRTLWCSRFDASITPRNAGQCCGLVYGLIGIFNNDKLVLIKQQQSVGVLPGGHEVFKIQRIVVVSLNSSDSLADVSLDNCPTHSSTTSSTGSSSMQKTWNQIKSTASHVKPRVVSKHLVETKEKYEKRIQDELYKMFNETDSFYYSLTGDITNSIQRQHQNKNGTNIPLWKKVDDRFFWNKFILQSLIDKNDDDINFWIIPIMQGFVQIENCLIDISNDDANDTNPNSWQSTKDEAKNSYQMALLSRRSRFRAGTRYKRRGVDENGKCANFVETEQIFSFDCHIVSFVIIRGSVPVFWSQPGHKYRPPPRLDRNEEETQVAFQKHFEEELKIYGKQVIVNLVEQTGREKVIADAYLNHLLKLDSPDLTYVTFDFHDYCRGMKFENVTILIENLKEIIKEMRYCWMDNDGMICDQRSVFRVNCIDCLDRTNIVQTAIARTVMDIQFVRLGLLPPEGVLPLNCRRIFQMMWANNGDIISRQYAGTVALKSDFTRTGERRITGVVRDGYNSASRYYVNRFKDAYRQATIDILQGIPVSDDLNSPEENLSESLSVDNEHHERVKLVIEDCKKILIPENEIVLGGWPLIDAENGYSNDHDMDTVLILTKETYYICEYDEQTDRIIKYQKVLLEDLEKIELGAEPNQIFSMRPKQNYCLRLHYLIDGLSGYFHMFRSTNTRFFNNMAIPIRNSDEELESLKAICESFKVALSVKSLNVPFYEGKLERRKSKLIHCINTQSADNNLLSAGQTSLPRNISDGQLRSLKSVGSRALTNVSSHFARLKHKWTSNGKTQPLTETDPKHAAFHVDSSGEESEDDSMLKLRSQKHCQPILAISEVFPERSLSSDYSECSDIEEHDAMMHFEEEAANLKRNSDLLESCGILATSPPLSKKNALNFKKVVKERSVLYDVDDFVLDSMKKASLRQMEWKASCNLIESSSIQSFTTPEIQVNDDGIKESISLSSNLSEISKTACRIRKLSKSSEDIETTKIAARISKNSSCPSASCATLIKTDSIKSKTSKENVRERNSLTVNSKMKTSHSETAIQDYSSGSLSLNLTNPLSSPIIIKKDLVLSPLSRIARGVQHLGMNLKSGTNLALVQRRVQPLTAENEQLNQRKINSKTKIIEL